MRSFQRKILQISNSGLNTGTEKYTTSSPALTNLGLNLVSSAKGPSSAAGFRVTPKGRDSCGGCFSGTIKILQNRPMCARGIAVLSASSWAC